MGEITIALHAPVAATRIRRWVEEQVSELRDAAWSSGVRLGDLSPTWQAQDADWLIDVDLRDRAVALEDDFVFGTLLMKMALLGLRPVLLSDQPADSPATPRAGAFTEAQAWHGTG